MITLYAAPTGNCHRVSILLEELGEAYHVIPIDFTQGENRTPSFLAVNPVGQVPAIYDPDGLDGKPLCLAESAAILAYLARKAGRFMPEGLAEQTAADYWVALLAGLQSAMTAIFIARRLGADPHAAMIEKLVADSDRYLSVINARLGVSAYLAGEQYTYVDMLAFSLAHRTIVVNGMTLDSYPAIERWRALIVARPAVQRGIAVPA